MPFKTIKEKLSSIKNPFSKKDKDNSNITGSATNQNKSSSGAPVKNQNVQQQTKEEKTKESNKEKLANGIANRLLQACIPSTTFSVPAFINCIAFALLKIPSGLDEKSVDKKYGFVNNVTDFKSALEKAVSCNKPKNSDITCHYLYLLRNHLLEWYTKEVNWDIYFKELSKIFKNAYSDAGNYKLFRPLLGYSKLNKALSECSTVCANIKKYIKNYNQQQFANSAAMQTTQEIVSNLQPSIQDLLKYLGRIDQNVCSAYNLNKQDIKKLTDMLRDLEQKTQGPLYK